jgi:hypothetical protein
VANQTADRITIGEVAVAAVNGNDVAERRERALQPEADLPAPASEEEPHQAGIP